MQLQLGDEGGGVEKAGTVQNPALGACGEPRWVSQLPLVLDSSSEDEWSSP